MAYGDYSGPNKPDKGKEGGSCNRTRCQCFPARWYNHGSYAWYCDDCKDQIYDTQGKIWWMRDFGHLGHHQFETRDMMDDRTAATTESAK